MAILAVVSPSLAGVSGAGVAAAGGGDSFPNDGYTAVLVANGSGAPITVTVDAAGPGGTGPDAAIAFNADITVSVPAGGSRLIGPFTDRRRWNDVNGRVNLTYSGVTSLTILPLRMG